MCPAGKLPLTVGTKLIDKDLAFAVAFRDMTVHFLDVPIPYFFAVTEFFWRLFVIHNGGQRRKHRDNGRRPRPPRRFQRAHSTPSCGILEHPLVTNLPLHRSPDTSPTRTMRRPHHPWWRKYNHVPRSRT